jgi:hypothetical protein
VRASVVTPRHYGLKDCGYGGGIATQEATNSTPIDRANRLAIRRENSDIASTRERRLAKLVGSARRFADQEGRHGDGRGPKGRVIDLLLLTNESDYSLDRVIHWLQQNEPELKVRRVNRENPAQLAALSAALADHGWSACETPKAAWLRQLLPERDAYGPALGPAEIDEILVRRRQWLGWTHVIGSLGTRWMNDPATTSRAESKVRQLARIFRSWGWEGSRKALRPGRMCVPTQHIYGPVPEGFRWVTLPLLFDHDP